MSQVDLSRLAVDRTVRPATRRRHALTRYVIPGALIAGFLGLLTWAGQDVVFPPKPVRVIPVFASEVQFRQEGTPLFRAAGWIEPRPTPIRIAALAPGVVETLLVVEDQVVEVGQPVAELVKDDARLLLERALADERLATAELAEAKADHAAALTRLQHPVHLEAQLGDAEADLAKVATLLRNLPFELRRAKANLFYAERLYNSRKAAKEAISAREVDKAQAAFDSATAMVEEMQHREASLRNEAAALQQRSEALRTQLRLLADEIQARDVAAARVRAGEARVAQARVTVDEARLRLSRMTIRAPAAGRIFRLIGHPGARLAGNNQLKSDGHDGSTVVTMYQPARLQVRVDVRFEDVPHVSLGQAVEIENPATAQPLPGHVLFISSEADIQKNTLQIKVAIDSPPEIFKPEMLVDVTFLSPPTRGIREDSATPATRLFLPRQYVAGGEEAYVWVADRAKNIARKTRIRTGAEGPGGMVEITAGLSLSSRVITDGTDTLKHGDRIEILGEDLPIPMTEGGTRHGGTSDVGRKE